MEEELNNKGDLANRWQPTSVVGHTVSMQWALAQRINGGRDEGHVSPNSMDSLS